MNITHIHANIMLTKFMFLSLAGGAENVPLCTADTILLEYFKKGYTKEIKRDKHLLPLCRELKMKHFKSNSRLYQVWKFLGNKAIYQEKHKNNKYLPGLGIGALLVVNGFIPKKFPNFVRIPTFNRDIAKLISTKKIPTLNSEVAKLISTKKIPMLVFIFTLVFSW